jgi:hypothetical protein
VTGERADCPTSTLFIFRTAGPADSPLSRSSLLPFQLSTSAYNLRASAVIQGRLVLPSARARRPLMGLLPALPGLQAAVAERPIMAASTFRATGIPVWDQAGQGAGPVVGRYTLMASVIPISLPINSGRRAPVLEGGGHSCVRSFRVMGMRRVSVRVNQLHRRGGSMSEPLGGGTSYSSTVESRFPTACNPARPSAHL